LFRERTTVYTYTRASNSIDLLAVKVRGERRRGSWSGVSCARCRKGSWGFSGIGRRRSWPGERRRRPGSRVGRRRPGSGVGRRRPGSGVGWCRPGSGEGRCRPGSGETWGRTRRKRHLRRFIRVTAFRRLWRQVSVAPCARWQVTNNAGNRHAEHDQLRKRKKSSC